MNDALTAVPARGGEVGLVEYQDFVSSEPFTFEDGNELPGFTLRYETYGKLNASRDNAVLICHALSGDHHCAGVYSLQDKKPGWWNNIIGPGKPIDTSHYYVICANCIGGCQGSTGPASINPETGKSYGLDFPAVSIGDMVRTQARLLDHLGIDCLHAAIGGSMGGMQALAWAILFPQRVRSILPMATTARQSAQAIAFNEVGRSAIVQDPGWQGGNYAAGEGPNVGLAVARMMAHITYLSDEGLERKFGRVRKNARPGSQFEVEFEVESYLRYQGKSFVNRFDANTYLYFTKALDRFDLYGEDDDLTAAFSQMQARALVVGFTSDWLFPSDQNRDIVHAMLRAGKDASYAEVSLDLG
ncbi:MAG: homoserine O-acetyltransferase, partial [Verrucomicrobiota bacterium]